MIKIPFGSVLANAKEVYLETTDNKQVKLSGTMARLALRFLGIPHIGLQVRARAVMSFLNPRSGDVVLDAGCGIGVYTLTYGFRGITVYGVDIDKKKIDQARKTSEQLKLGNYCYFTKADLTKLPFENEFFDRILCSETLEHVDDDKKAIDEMHRVLKKDGVMVISVPSDIYINQRYKETFGHHRLYTIEKMQELLNHNFKIETIARRNKVIGQLAWLINRKMFFSKVLVGLTYPFCNFLTYIDFYGPGRELVIKARKR